MDGGEGVAARGGGGRLATLVCLVAVEASGEMGWRRIDVVGLVGHDDERFFLELLVVVVVMGVIVWSTHGEWVIVAPSALSRVSWVPDAAGVVGCENGLGFGYAMDTYAANRLGSGRRRKGRQHDR